MNETDQEKKEPADKEPNAFDGVTGERLAPPEHEVPPIEQAKRRPGRPRKVVVPFEPPVDERAGADRLDVSVIDAAMQLPPPDNSDAWRRNSHERPYVDPFVREGAPEERPFEPPFVPVTYMPDTTEETVRQSGLAWSMGIVFFGSVAFMLFLGWLADLLLGSSPWGIVVGVVLGSVIGFVQFFRISSQIFTAKSSDHHSLLSKDNDEQPPRL